MKPDPKEMKHRELIAEFAANFRELNKLAKSIKGFSAWEKSTMAVSVTLAIAGLAFAPHTAGLSLVLTAASIVVLAARIVKKIYELTQDPKLRAQASALESRNAEILADLKRRYS